MQRIADAFDQIPLAPTNITRQQTIMYHLLRDFPGYQPVVTVSVQGNRQTRTATYGEFHKSMLYSPHARVRDFGSLYSGMMTDYIRTTFNVRLNRPTLDRQNSIYRFAAIRNDQGQVIEFRILARYDAWLRYQPLEAQRVNLKFLIDRIEAEADHDGHASIVASSIAKYLVKNIARWSTADIQRLLFSDAVLFHSERLLSRERAAFTAALLQPLPQPNGETPLQIPPAIVQELGSRMRIVHRNTWAQHQFHVRFQIQNAPVEFADWASKRKIDLPSLVNAPLAQKQQLINRYAGTDLNRYAEATGVLNWLAQGQNAANAPQ